uniref:5' nucleotidase n=1 Tax=virus sp. ct8MV80 TaxID=2826793 RepID=A0A8S5R8K9_9VIRU|nr:MAG TPA: 5' nucleotidase [virus sp. ct8MV80]
MNTLKQPMEIVKNIDIDLNKRTIFLDVDDVLLDSSVAVIAILN